MSNLTPPWQVRTIGQPCQYFMQVMTIIERKYGVVITTSGKVQCLISLN